MSKKEEESRPVQISRRQMIRNLASRANVPAGAAVEMAALWDRRGDAGLQGRPPLTLPNYNVALKTGAPTMAIVHGANVPTMVRAAVGELGGFEHFIKRGDVVMVKPNVAFDRAPILGATTNPEVLFAVVRYCYE